jgi:hypothetical protein
VDPYELEPAFAKITSHSKRIKVNTSGRRLGESPPLRLESQKELSRDETSSPTLFRAATTSQTEEKNTGTGKEAKANPYGEGYWAVSKSPAAANLVGGTLPSLQVKCVSRCVSGVCVCVCVCVFMCVLNETVTTTLSCTLSAMVSVVKMESSSTHMRAWLETQQC